MASKQGDNDLAYECCCEQDTPETTPDRCYDDPTYRETTLTGMSCHEWAHTDTNHDYYADCSQTDALYLTATSCSTGTHPTAAQLVDSYACEEGGYGPLDSTTRTGNGHLDHSLPQCNHKDDPDFRLRGFSCAQWGVPRAGNGVVECMASEDYHWIATEGYTQAELDSLRTNCPATCARDATGTLDNVGSFTVYAGVARQDTCAFYGGDHDGNGVVDCLASQAATRIGEGTGITHSDLDAIRKSCPETCGQCAKKHFYYPPWLMNEVRKHCPAACSSSCSGTPFGSPPTSIECTTCANGNAGGVCLVALTASECPTNPDAFGNCAASTPVGGLCEADGELSTDIHLDNCDDDYDFYKVAECHAP